MRTSPLHDEFDQLRLASSEGCGLYLRMRAILTGTLDLLHTVSSVQSHYPMIVTSNILVYTTKIRLRKNLTSEIFYHQKYPNLR